MIWVLLLLAQSATPTQIERGEALFFDTAHGCGACHALKGKGTAVGPDLRDVARLSPKGIAMAVRSTVTQYVQVVKLKDGRTFPAMPPKGDQVYDLSKIPPEAIKAGSADIASTTANNGWRHPAGTQNLTEQQIADLVAYIRYAGANNRSPVAPDDIK
jgi:putative heme-binding domain-containing protein